MANEVGRGVVGIEPDLSGFQEKIGREVEQATSAASRRAQKSIDVGKKLTLGVTGPILGLAAASIKAASDVEEMQSKFQTVFGDMSGEVEDWARTHGDAVNRSRFDIQGYLATLQDTFVPMGIARDEAADLSKQIAALGIDLASFNNLAEPEVIQNLTSALVGNHDAVRKFGVVINEAGLNAELMRMGVEGGTKAASEQEKILARVNLIVAGTADAQGDAARTSESFANQMRGLKANLEETAVELGQHLLPLATDMVQVFGKAVSVFADLPEPVQRSIVVAGGLAAAIGPLAIIGGQAAKGILAMKGAIQALAAARAARQVTTVATGIEAIGANAASAIPSVRTFVGGFAKLGIAAIAAGNLAEAVLNVTGEVDKFADSSLAVRQLEMLGQGAEYSAEGMYDLTRAITGAGLRIRDDSGLFTKGASAIENLATRIPGVTLEVEHLVDTFERVDSSLAGMIQSGRFEEADAQLDVLRRGFEANGVPLEQLIDELLPSVGVELAALGGPAGLAERASADLAEQVEETGEVFDATTDAVNRAKDAHDEYQAALRAAVDPVFRLNRAIGAVDDAQESYNEAVKEYGRQSDEARQAAFDLASALSDAEQAAIDGDLSFGEFAAKLRDWVAQGVLTADQADAIGGRVAELRGEADRYTGTYTAHLEAQLPTEDIDSLRTSLRDLTSKRWTVIVDQMVRGDRLPSPGGGPDARRARGGPLHAGQLALVGEEGPELWVPDAAGQVVSTDNSIKQMAAAIADAISSTSQPSKRVELNLYGDPDPRLEFRARDLAAVV